MLRKVCRGLHFMSLDTSCTLKSMQNPLLSISRVSPSLPNTEYVIHQQVRTTYILKRKWPLRYTNFSRTDDPIDIDIDRSKTYEELPQSAKRTPVNPVLLLLIQPIEGIGGPGDVLEVGGRMGRKYLLMNKAVYGTAENIQKYAYLKDIDDTSGIPSSPYVHKTMKRFLNKVFNVSMNLDTPWVLEKWHVRVAFRKAGVIVPEESIILNEKQIKGPDLNLEGKEFLVKIMINNKEEAKARVRVHHVATDARNRLPWKKDHWLEPVEAIFTEEAQELKRLMMLIPKFVPTEEIDED